MIIKPNNSETKETKETYKVDKKAFSMYIENIEGEYVEYESNKFFPTGYLFNEDKSSCIDLKGNNIKGILTNNGNSITVTTNKTVFCYIYFDIIEVNSVLINDNNTYTTNQNVTLNLSSTMGKQMCISESLTCTNWEDFSSNKLFTLNSDLGLHTINVYYKDAKEEIKEVVSDTIYLYEMLEFVPSQSGSLTYTGSSQNPNWNNYDSTKMTIGGSSNGTNAGNYTITFTPKENYIWSDGTQSTKSTTWNIGKANGTISLSETNGNVLRGENKNITITNNLSGGTLSATSGNNNIATVNVSGNIVTINGVSEGNTTITITSAETDNFFSSSTVYNITVEEPMHVSASGEVIDDWATIKKGTYAKYYSIGNWKSFTNSYGNVIVMEIVGLGVDTTSSGTAATATWLSKQIMFLNNMSSSSTMPSNGWYGSTLRSNLNNNYYNSIPAEVRNAITSVRKTYYAGSSIGIRTTTEKIWIPSYREIFGGTSRETSGPTYSSYFSTNTSRVKHALGSGGEGAIYPWYLRSVNEYDNGFIFVNAQGNYGTGLPTYEAGAVIGFCT